MTLPKYLNGQREWWGCTKKEKSIPFGQLALYSRLVSEKTDITKGKAFSL